MSNPMRITIHANSQCTITASSNAAYDQFLNVTDGSATWYFEGAGENQAMIVKDGGDGSTNDSVTMDPQQSDRDILLLFQYAGPRGINYATVGQPVVTVIPLGQTGILTRYVVSTEDGADNDKDDTIAVVECIKLN